jgi:hypothetical protein
MRTAIHSSRKLARAAVSIRINVEIAGSDRNALQNLRREIERIAAYDGKTVTVTFNNELPSLISSIAPVNPAMVSMLSAADAAVSPWYRTQPIGKPFQARVDAASDTLRQHFQERVRTANRSAGLRVFTNRADYIAANIDAISAKFGYPRGLLETHYQSLLAAQNNNSSS